METTGERGEGKKEHRREKEELNVESLIGVTPGDTCVCLCGHVCVCAGMCSSKAK